jgi:hypothetical protein
MSDQAKRSSRWLFVLAVLAALAFGGRVALANASMTCPPDAIGTCTSQSQCQDMCDVEYGVGNSEGDCYGLPSNGCCRCLL